MSELDFKEKPDLTWSTTLGAYRPIEPHIQKMIDGVLMEVGWQQGVKEFKDRVYVDPHCVLRHSKRMQKVHNVLMLHSFWFHLETNSKRRWIGIKLGHTS